MASTSTLYNPFRAYSQNGTIDLDTDTIRAALVANTYTFSAAHGIWGDVSTHEVTNGAGYTTGGIALVNSTVSYTGAVGKWTADNPLWTALTKTFRFAVLYANKTANGFVNPLIGCILLNNTPADIVVAGLDYSIQWNANGIMSITSP